MGDRDIAAIAGGARGIGFGISRRMATTSYDVALFDMDQAALDDAEAGFERLAKRQPEQPQDDLADRQRLGGFGEGDGGDRRLHLRRTISHRRDALQHVLPS